MASVLCLAAAIVGLSCQAPLCVNSHPAPRSNDVTYGGLTPRPGYQRDHIVPLCLGGPDTLDNLQYQPLEQAHIKDHIEWLTCEQYCRGEITLEDARNRFQRDQ